MNASRVVSGMRPSGRLHLGHYHGVLKNWVQLQYEYPCFFFIADWHALTTHYQNTEDLAESSLDMLVDWLAVGLNPSQCAIFRQSEVPEHAELFTLLSMITPLSWLERVPTYKEQQEKLKDLDLSTYGFLGYPLLQAADILIYKAKCIPIGEDQLPHLELTREIARRFNHLYGHEPDFESLVELAIEKLGGKQAALYRNLRAAYQERGDLEALERAQALVAQKQNLLLLEQERLCAYLEGSSRSLLPEPQALLTPASKMPGLDGQKMSKSYGNTIALTEEPSVVQQKILTMPTDPARIRRSDPGTPEKCPVWNFHQLYSNAEVQAWAHEGCTTAGIGCVDCKKPVIEAVIKEQEPFLERAREYRADGHALRRLLKEGAEQARSVASETLLEVRQSMGLDL